MYDWQAAEVFELVKGWPGKSRAHIGYGTGGGGEWVQRDGTTLEPRHAAALHVASAVAYVLTTPGGVFMEKTWDGQVVAYVMDKRGMGPTELHALSAAIEALAPAPDPG